MKCKGGEPSLMTVKDENSNPLLNNMDPNLQKTKLEKDINKQKKDAMMAEQKEIENQKRLEEAQGKFDNGELDDESDKSDQDVEEQPSGII
jgi:hypothetical protein